MNKKLAIALLFILFKLSLYAQWHSINPGAGGQVQDIVTDPNTPNTVYLVSDMEGVYKSTNNGDQWHMTGKLVSNRVFALAVTPGNAQKLYVGTLFGLHTSVDGGKSYQFVPLTLKRTIGCVSVSPHNPNVVVAGFGWRDDYEFLWIIDGKQTGKGQVVISRDGGKTWKIIDFNTSDESKDRNVWTVNFDPTNEKIIYLSTGGGIYKSIDEGITWSLVPAPENTKRHTGIAISPDGKVVYATYATDDEYGGNIYASTAKNIQWQKVMTGKGLALKQLNYWYPETDPRFNGATHKVLIGLNSQRDGLFEGTFEWNGEVLQNYSWETIWQGTAGYDNGWDWADPNARVAHYTPSKWPRAVWSTTNQTIFEGAYLEDHTWEWHNKYSKPKDGAKVNWHGQEFKTYSSRGTESTYTYDIAADENYILQGQGDNGLMESWDGGFSWNNMQHRTDSFNYSDVQAVAIAKSNGIPTVIAQATTGYGGAARDGQILVKKLIHHSPEDNWMFLGGGPGKVLGLPAGVFREIAVAPSNPNKVYMFSSNNGMYMISNLGEAIDKKEKGEPYTIPKISSGIIEGVKTCKKISVHPTNEDIIFFTGTSGDMGVYKGVNTNGQWTWSKIYKGHSWEAEVISWLYNGKVYLAYAGASEEKQNDKCHFVVAISEDEGATWRTVFTKDNAKKIRGHANDAWYPYIAKDYIFQSKGGIAADGNTIICNFYNHKYQNGFGIFKGTMQPDKKINWVDWTGDLHFSGVTSGMFAKTEGKWYYYISTPGAGAWRREADWLNK